MISLIYYVPVFSRAFSLITMFLCFLDISLEQSHFSLLIFSINSTISYVKIGVMVLGSVMVFGFQY